MKSRASDRRRAQILVRAALFVAGAYFIWHVRAGPDVNRAVSYSEFTEKYAGGGLIPRRLAPRSRGARTQPLLEGNSRRSLMGLV